MNIVANNHVLVRELGGEAVLLDPNAGMYYGLNNPVAVWVWNRCSVAGGATLSSLVDEVMNEFNVEHAVAEREIADFVETLRASGLANVTE